MKRKIIILGAVLVLLASAAVAAITLLPKDYDIRTMLRAAPIGTGYAAKMLCSGVFVSGREPETLWKEDLELMRKNMIRGGIDFDNRSAKASVLGFLAKRTAVYREHCGCTLAIGVSEEELRRQCDVSLPSPPPDIEDLPWPTGDAAPDTPPAPGIDRKQLEDTLDWAFSEKSSGVPKRTRAVIVLYDGRIIAERYADGYSKETRFLGWSMTKSVTSALIGILVRMGKLDIYKPAPVDEWRAPGDPRGEITVNDLLHMSGGLAFKEEYEQNPDSDAGFMFFTVHDMAKFAARKPLVAAPGEKFSYSSGTTMLLARIIRETIGGTHRDYLAFSRSELFNKTGMTSAIIETDPSGTMVGAGFMYATARDWARFGLLYYNDGVWNGERILPEGWVEYTRTPTPSYAGYGAQFWLNTEGEDQWLPNCPADIYSARGHEGQFVTIVPSRKTIIVRLGQTFNATQNWDHDYFVSNILKAMPD